MNSVIKYANMRHISILSRVWSGPRAVSGQTHEKRVQQTLKQRFPNARTIQVVDISGGCGAMFEVLVETEEFKGLTMVNQHRMINEALKEEIKDMHGLRIHTSVPP